MASLRDAVPLLIFLYFRKKNLRAPQTKGFFYNLKLFVIFAYFVFFVFKYPNDFGMLLFFQTNFPKERKIACSVNLDFDNLTGEGFRSVKDADAVAGGSAGHLDLLILSV